VVAEEMNLASLCVRYLSFEYFRDNLSSRTVVSYCTSGIYIFLEYVAVYWISHVEAFNNISDEYNKENVYSLAQQVGALLNLYWGDWEMSPIVSCTIKGRSNLSKNIPCLPSSVKWQTKNS